ncbi:hypothetical protein TorRG33x02_193510 [Trema orientale]|uniref:Uncharacterized protein n=1 Tax=Trema orientale TaxID=63057 RepID=A0A2P5EGY7_TREOI|nr:hypothetical protein TorRG33x02_193510 [Trema orientale]
MGYEIVRVTMNNNILTSALHPPKDLREEQPKAGQHHKPNSQRSRFQSRQPPRVIQGLLQDNLHRQNTIQGGGRTTSPPTWAARAQSNRTEEELVNETREEEGSEDSG